MTSLYDVPRFYDALYTAAEATTYYGDLAQRGTALELACGSGRITIPLAKRGIEMTGLDASQPMLDRARSSSPDVTWTLGDMRTFDLGRKFETVFIAHNSLLHLHDAADIVRCFERARAHLAPGGRFAFDVFNPSVALLSRAKGERRRFGGFHDEEHGEVFVEDTVDYDAATQVNRATLFFSTAERPDFLTVPLHLRTIFPQELPLLVERAGLVLESRTGGFDGRAFDSKSRHQVCICRAE